MAEPRVAVIPYTPRAAFRPLHYRAQRWAVVVAHRRAGKTVACINELIMACCTDSSNNGRYAYIAPYYAQAKSVAWDYAKYFSAPIPYLKINESELRIDYPNGARLQLFGADNADRLRGLYFDGLIADEYGDWKPSVWAYVIRPALADRKGWAIMIGTPKGKNQFWQRYRQALENPDWFTMKLTATASGLLDRQELLSMQAEMSEDAWRQEMECDFDAAIPGAIYGREMYEVERSGRIAACYDHSLKTYAALDLGWSDDTAIWWYQVAGNELRLVDCYSNSGMPISHYHEVLVSKGYHYGECLYLPHDAKAKSLQTGRSIEEQFRALGWMPRIVPKLGLMDGIQAARLSLANCWFDPKCSDGMEALKQYQRDYDEDKKVFRERPRHDWASHYADSFRYTCLAWRQMRPADDKKPPAFWDSQTLDQLWQTTAGKSTRI